MKSIRKLKPFIQPYWKPSVLALVLLTLVVFIDLAIPRLIQRIIDQGIFQNDQQVVVRTTLLMLSLSVLSTLFAVGNNLFSIQAGEGVARDLREALFLQIQSFSYGNLDHMNTGQLMVRLSSDTSVVQRLVQVSLRIGTRAPLLMLGSLILMYTTAPSLAPTMIPILLVMVALIAWFVTRMSSQFRIVQQKLDRLNTTLQENVAGVRVVKAFVQADHERARFAEANQDFTEHTIHVTQLMDVMSPVLTVLVNLGIVVVIWAGGIRAIRGELTIGQIIAFTNYLQTALGPLLIMARLSNVFAAGAASVERVLEVLETKPEVRDALDALALPETVRRRVDFEEVSFGYNGSHERAVLQNINLDAQPGETIAILGATGAGKTTLVNLIPRFYDVSSGKLLVSGSDVRRIRQDDLLAQVGIVPQETVLFSGTVRDNIRYGKPEAAEAEVVAAAKAAQAHEFILDLPEGYDTHVEARGVNLSGGQKQRIAIARALLTHPGILILDDSTSSVDVETETKIQAALKDWLGDSTSFVVAQRISTVLNADQIIVLDRGRIAARGTHRELMQSSPIYQEIYASQLGDGVTQQRASR